MGGLVCRWRYVRFVLTGDCTFVFLRSEEARIRKLLTAKATQAEGSYYHIALRGVWGFKGWMKDKRHYMELNRFNVESDQGIFHFQRKRISQLPRLSFREVDNFFPNLTA